MSGKWLDWYDPIKEYWDPIPRLWPDSDVVVCASGPSLDQADLELLRGVDVKVIVVNRMWAAAPWADLLYAADKAWWESKEAPGPGEFNGLMVSASKTINGTVKVNVRHTDQLNPRWLCNGTNSGMQALCLAANLGARRIGLLGYTMGAGPGGELHSHPDHQGMVNPKERDFARWRAAFGRIAGGLRDAGVDVVNCSESKLDCFRRAALRDFLQG